MALTLDFAFEGFRILKKKKSLIFAWGLFAVLLSVVTMAAFFILSGAGIAAYTAMITQAAEGGVEPSPQQMMSVMAGLIPGYLAAIPLNLIGASMMLCAVMRAVLQPMSGGFGYLKLGADEGRQILLMIVICIIHVVAIIVACIAASLVIAIASAAKIGVVTGLATFVAVVAAFLAYIYFASRMSLAAPLVFDTRKFDVFGSLKLTKGHGWTLFFGYVVMCIMMFVAIVVIELVFLAVIVGIIIAVVAAGAVGPMHGDAPDFSQMNLAVVIPAGLVCLLLYIAMFWLMVALMYALMYGAPAAAYRTLAKPAAPLFAPIIDALEDMADQDA
jgi:magnesium-transporting ATPase (P-type)